MDKKEYFVHESSYIDEGAEIGRERNLVFLSCPERRCNRRTVFSGQNVNISNNVRIGNGVKIQNKVSVYEGVELEDDVFCGPSMVFTNDLTPRAKYPKGSAGYKRRLFGEERLSGRNATIVCGHELGECCTVAAELS